MLRMLSLMATSVITAVLYAQDIHPSKSEVEALPENYSPYVDRNVRTGGFAENLYWGDPHLHTSLSMDAGMVGNTLGPEEAYHFARGETVTTSSGQRVRANRPLDFLVVADHAENLGLPLLLAEGDPALLKTECGRRFYDMMQAGQTYEAFMLWGLDGLGKQTDVIGDPQIARTAWERQIEAAEQFNDPGNFTALIGFEWTSSGTLEDPGNLHRVVIFRDDGDKASQVVPFSTFDSDDPEDLWAYLANYETKTGGQVLAIPHNGNLSNGKMFPLIRANGKPIDADYARMRMTWEPLVESTQIKGDSEAHPLLSPNDEFADYGSFDKADTGGVKAKTPEMLPHEYARTALQIGLQQQQKLGLNPFKMGQIGSSDSHTSVATIREENFWGKLPSAEPKPDRWKGYVNKSVTGDERLSTFEYEVLASGLAAVWARENTREALFDAMAAKEVYATTGTRIAVRFFGGWNYVSGDVFRPNAVEIGYAEGVPMGGDLPPVPEGAKAPVFMVGAMKDPWSGNLDRIQVVKGWVDADGERHERIYDVAVSDGREIGRNGHAREAVGNTVDVANATWTNTIGDAELRAVWTDPEFDPTQPAVYYARVLEIPTPTWQAYDEKRFGITMTAAAFRAHTRNAPIHHRSGTRRKADSPSTAAADSPPAAFASTVSTSSQKRLLSASVRRPKPVPDRQLLVAESGISKPPQR